MASPSDSPADEQVRAAVADRYSRLARAARSGQQITDCGRGAFTGGRFGAAGYADTSELPEGAVRASLGCGNPVAVADLHPGETVLDLGSGGGIDVLLSARRVSPGGKAYGLDAAPDMIALARENAAQAGVTNAKFLHDHIEDIPLPAGHVDVVISNCVINLSADKPRALAAAFRVLRPGGRLGISDIIADDGLDPARRAEAEQLTGCTTGTLATGSTTACCLTPGSPASTSPPPRRPGPACARRSSRPPGRPPSRRADPVHGTARRGRCPRHLRGWPGHRRSAGRRRSRTARAHLQSPRRPHPGPPALADRRADGGEACICDLTGPVALSQPTVSHHMKQLADAGLVTREQRGKWAYYRVLDDTLRTIAQAIAPATETPRSR